MRSNGKKLVGRGERAGPPRGRSPHPFERNPRRGRPPQTHNPRLGAGTTRSHRSQRLPSGNLLRQRHAGSVLHPDGPSTRVTASATYFSLPLRSRLTPHSRSSAAGSGQNSVGAPVRAGGAPHAFVCRRL
ncbi:hypothetical protein NDU88_006381 [Pleurodeles waltl]|uniref:Uncharacterized protein n=1 Tax=Pleurodeles waltl TaxID=8319 RepID=A0AAV7VR86_PLEWA|nr:hypothetical protein NDU88_006381 [Pleurodeles waltl]